MTQRALGLPQQQGGSQGSAPDQAAASAQIRSPLGRGAAAGALDRLAAEEPALAQRLASIDPQLLQALQDHLAKGTPLRQTASPDRMRSRNDSAQSHEDGESRLSELEGRLEGRKGEGVTGIGGFRGSEAKGRGDDLDGRDFSASGLGGVGGVLPGSEADGGVDNLNALPVSAVAMGLAPERSGERTPSGADIAMDALAEEEVAHMAQRFFQQQQLLQPPPTD